MSVTWPRQFDSEYLQIRDKLRGSLVLFLGIVLSLGLAYWSTALVRPRNADGATVSTIRGVVGWPTAVEPLATLAGARRFSRQAGFRGMVIERLKSDGTLDLENERGSTKYVFQAAPRPPGKNALHAVAPVAEPSCPKQVVFLRRNGLTSLVSEPSARCTGNQLPLPMPTCGPREVFQLAMAKGASPKWRVRLEYYRADAGPAWRLRYSPARFHFAVSSDCRRELLPLEAKGEVP